MKSVALLLESAVRTGSLKVAAMICQDFWPSVSTIKVGRIITVVMLGTTVKSVRSGRMVQHHCVFLFDVVLVTQLFLCSSHLYFPSDSTDVAVY